MKILECRHHSPYDGCSWQLEYYHIDGKSLTPIFATPRQQCGKMLTYAEYKQGSAWPYDGFTVRVAGRKLWEFVPDSVIPDFWEFFQSRGESFVWKCDHCGLTQEPPVEMRMAG